MHRPVTTVLTMCNQLENTFYEVADITRLDKTNL
uniref:Uncharacterized protein n=1 Tax=Anguilla anguilla TaxID=7936 RepID=A0A0E9REN2_ANGAN